jgi:hypothetical protein
MTSSRDRIAGWLDDYFQAVNTHQGAVETVAKLRAYFADDLEFRMYTATSPHMSVPLNREQLLLTFVHPGLVEQITPKYYVIDPEALTAVVQFTLLFRDESSAREWPARQASAHYHLREEAAGELVIAKIQYWTEILTEEFGTMFEQWEKARTDALAAFGMRYFRDPR